MGDAANPNPKPPGAAGPNCEECRSYPWKYRCPGCEIKTCSLPCVKSHKARTGCTGKRDLAQVVSLSKFDDKLLLSDYNLLEETKRVAESARRTRIANGFNQYVGSWLPESLRMLQRATRMRKTELILLPSWMSKREMNQSRYDISKDSIFWTVEWRFHETDVVIVDHGVDEHISFSSVLEKHLAPSPFRNKLTPFRNAQLDDLNLFLRKSPKGLESPFRELNINAPIGGQLADVVIQEFPVIFVFLPSHSYEFEVERSFMLPPKKEESPGSPDDNQSPKGHLFMEDEIEEGEMSSDTLVTDLIGHVNSAPSTSVQAQQDCLTAGKPVNVSNIDTSREGANGLKPNSMKTCQTSKVLEAKRKYTSPQVLQDSAVQITTVAETENISIIKPQVSMVENAEVFSSIPVDPWNPSADAHFDFQQEFRDAYSDLIGEINPDEFLCLDGGLNDVDSLEQFLREDELEDGEIPSQ